MLWWCGKTMNKNPYISNLWPFDLIWHVKFGCPTSFGTSNGKRFLDSLSHSRNEIIYYINNYEWNTMWAFMIFSRVRVTSYLHTWEEHRCYGYINCAFVRVICKESTQMWNGLVFHCMTAWKCKISFLVSCLVRCAHELGLFSTEYQ